ncbi:MAG: hypothetical protein WBJ73_05470 [Caldicoprobacterales bacterium]
MDKKFKKGDSVDMNKRAELMEPPLFHVVTQWDEGCNKLFYTYKGTTLITVHIPDNLKPQYRFISDGNLCSTPMAQQMYITLPKDVWVKVDFNLSEDAINMRPNRAESGQAILGQVGKPLIYGANGIYDINEDMLISWHGCQWRWLENSINKDGDKYSCSMEVKLGPAPWVLLFRMQYYRTHLGFKYHEPWNKRPNNKAVTGWCSWEAYHRDIYAHNIPETVNFLEKEFKEFGLEYVQIDDGYQDLPQPYDINDNYYDIFLKTNDKFPNGHSDIIEPIKAGGLKPGIWTNVSITNDDYAKEANYIFKDDNGEPIKCDWLGYCMDCTDDTIENQVNPLYKGFKDMGYEYFKLDSIRHMIFDGLRKMVDKGILTNEEANTRFRNLIKGIRESVGDDAYFLACWGVLTEVIGLADACRIATDSGPNWSQIRMQLFESARWFYTQRILFTNDPDHICVRADIEYARSVLSLVTLSGGLYMLSDSVDKYDDERINMIKKTMPALTTVAAETGPIDYTRHAWGRVLDWDRANSHENDTFGSLWSIHFCQDDRQWSVVGRFGIHELQESRTSLEDLGLDPEKSYAAFDFWEQKFLGIVDSHITLKALKLGHCQVIVLRAIEDAPCLVASDRHVSMDAVSIISEQYDENVLTISLNGVKGYRFNYWLYIPEGMKVKTISYEGCNINYDAKEELGKLEVDFLSEEVKLEVSF